jgi:hypothetical protein
MKNILFSLLLCPLSISAQCPLLDNENAAIADNRTSVLASDTGCDAAKVEPIKPLYPNPTNGFVWSPMDGDVYDVRGLKVGILKSGDNDVTDLAQGVYFVVNRALRVTLRFVKM